MTPTIERVPCRPRRIRNVSSTCRPRVRRSMRPRDWVGYGSPLPRDVRRILARTAAGRRQLAARREGV